tara:strand:- start:233 stop:541 length:309 start_codon:yes stop_codon:yes gene_type:complete
MSVTTPVTTEEWVSYILDEIPNEDLIHQSRVAGSNAFLRTLKEEGFEAPALASIHRAFALRFVREGMRVPSRMDNCHIDYNAMVENPDSELKEMIEKFNGEG